MQETLGIMCVVLSCSKTVLSQNNEACQAIRGTAMACAAIWAGLAGDEQLFHLEVAVRHRGKNIPVEIDSKGSTGSVPLLSVCTASSSHDCDVALKLSSEHLLPVCVDIVMKMQNAVCGRSSVHVGFSRLLFWNFASTFSSPAVLHTTRKTHTSLSSKNIYTCIDVRVSTQKAFVSLFNPK